MSRQDADQADAPEATSGGIAHRIRAIVVPLLQAILAVEILLLILRGHYFSAFLAGGVLMLPILFQKMRLQLPPEMQLAFILFSFCTLFLGEVQNYYERYWWWDLVIHFSSGLMLGVFGLLLVYILNENRAVDRHFRSGFLALFAFAFAVAIGAMWEVFEFAVDQTFGTHMQKPRPGDPSGLTDTMWDLSVDILGAAIISLFSWRRRKQGSWDWMSRLISSNAKLFGD